MLDDRAAGRCLGSTHMDDQGYARARWVGDLCLLSGLVASPRHLDGDLTAQAGDVFAQAEVLLGEQGLGLSDVVSVTGYLINPENFGPYDLVWRATFPTDAPVRTTVASGLLVPGALIELAVTAARTAPHDAR